MAELTNPMIVLGNFSRFKSSVSWFYEEPISITELFFPSLSLLGVKIFEFPLRISSYFSNGFRFLNSESESEEEEEEEKVRNRVRCKGDSKGGQFGNLALGFLVVGAADGFTFGFGFRFERKGKC